MEKRLHRNEHDKVVAGVASGVATYMQVDVTIIRLLFVLSTIFLAGAGILAYIVLWVVSPVNNDPAFKYKQFNDLYSQPGSSPFNSGDAFNNPYQDAIEDHAQVVGGIQLDFPWAAKTIRYQLRECRHLRCRDQQRR